MKKPNQEKKNTRPYKLNGFRTGIDRALWLIGFLTGSLQRTVKSTILLLVLKVLHCNNFFFNITEEYEAHFVGVLASHIATSLSTQLGANTPTHLPHSWLSKVSPRSARSSHSRPIATAAKGGEYDVPQVQLRPRHLIQTLGSAG
jgi:hypothetical protein